MRIGLFTDTYRPSINGIVYVVDITRKHLESMGHEVFIFCPNDGVRFDRSEDEDDDHIIRFRSMKGVFFDDYNLSLFFPTRELRRIKELQLDVIQFFTPSQVGMMGVYAAQKTGAILISQHSTDLAQYIRHYPAVVPGLLMISLTLPLTFRFDGKDVRELMKLYKPRRAAQWGVDIVESLVAMIYSRCDAVVALSRKSQKQLESWRGEYWYEVECIPTGVNALKKATSTQIESFKEEHGIVDTDKVILYVGRLSSEKNLDILIPSLELVLESHPEAKLVYVGDFEYRETLETLAAESSARDRIVFTGALLREQLGVAYGVGDIFAFPSLTDTQGLVLHEAAQAGLPFVLIDREVSEVVRDGENGVVADNTPESVADAVVSMLDDDTLREKYGERSRQLARQYGEYAQTKKMEQMYKRALEGASIASLANGVKK